MGKYSKHGPLVRQLRPTSACHSRARCRCGNIECVHLRSSTGRAHDPPRVRSTRENRRESATIPRDVKKKKRSVPWIVRRSKSGKLKSGGERAVFSLTLKSARDNHIGRGGTCFESHPLRRVSFLHLVIAKTKKNPRMANETLTREMDAHIVTILSRLSALRENNADERERKAPMSIEARSLELWRAVAVECLATFFFSLVVAGAAAASSVSGSGLSALATAVASGFAIAAISLIFGHISGGHVNPAVSVSFALCRRISPLRAVLYIAAQCGGGIAGAAMLYGRIRKACGPSKAGPSFLPSVRTAAGGLSEFQEEPK
ncbi:Neurogenic protein big brain [Temnothorax longispinosus]|uniref:Neurogenic protein big brain n=1 Tax=Temnothorax longispinosus TaxID=300112 RepID=A0A4S2JJE4_9HYME|nr:Neurogenic protein big brain [Temnothorax longispinosus]